MPYSHDAFNGILAKHINTLAPSSILDVGAGSGKLADILESKYKIDCIEMVPKYVEQFRLDSKYNKIYLMSLSDYINHYHHNMYDFVYFGDILEHLFLSEAINYLDFLSYRSKWIAVAWPTNMYQGAWEGQKSEIHKSNFKLSDLLRFDIQYYQKVFLNLNPSGSPVEYHYCLIKGILGDHERSI